MNESRSSGSLLGTESRSAGPEAPSKTMVKSRSNSASTSAENEIDKDLMQQIVLWMDGLSIPWTKTELAMVRLERDFSDGYLLAELIAQHHPKLVDLHHYVRASSLQNKRHNWHHLRRKVLSNPKIDLHLSDELIEMIIESKPGAIDKVLKPIYEIAMRIECEKRELEEEKARATADPLPVEEWRQDVCFIRNDQKGQREYMINGRLMVQKDIVQAEVKAKDQELIQLRATNEQLKSQVARLQMIVDLKEDRLGELTHQLSIYQRQEQNIEQSNDVKLSATPTSGPHGDSKIAALRRSLFPN